MLWEKPRFSRWCQIKCISNEKWFNSNEHFVATLFKRHTTLMFSNLHRSNQIILKSVLNIIKCESSFRWMLSIQVFCWYIYFYFSTVKKTILTVLICKLYKNTTAACYAQWFRSALNQSRIELTSKNHLLSNNEEQ